MRPFFYACSNGVRVTVRPWYLAAQSQPSRGHFVFGYAVRIENIDRGPIQLLSRCWRIADSTGDQAEVRGEGVVGECPVIAPFRAHEYQSYSVLKSPAGFMEGHYTFARSDGSRFEARIPRFPLEAGTRAGS